MSASTDVSEAILSKATPEGMDAALFEKEVLSEPGGAFFVSRRHLREHIDAEVAFGRLRESDGSLSITERGRRRLAKCAG